mmetsp:Transcript_73525/g.107911  ORF Transcript_73525/g.107911 Transcript_73525/m.107911 type:complete len:85 (-) Transcript_73525:47-301(-)
MSALNKANTRPHSPSPFAPSYIIDPPYTLAPSYKSSTGSPCSSPCSSMDDEANDIVMKEHEVIVLKEHEVIGLLHASPVRLLWP